MNSNDKKMLSVVLIVGGLLLGVYVLAKMYEKKQMVGGCGSTQYGCCPDGVTAKADAAGSNCIVGGCRSTRYGCCPDGVTAKADAAGSNC